MSNYVAAITYGGPEALAVLDETLGDPGPGQVKIQVRAIGTNPVDYMFYSGAMGKDESKLPLRVGSEAAGVVVAVGPDAVGPSGPVSVGDEVIAYRAPGAYAQELLVPGSAVVPKPSALDWSQAAGLLLTGTTATHTLEATRVGSGDTVLVHGASGGVGVFAVQLAKLRGATVIATASARNHEFLEGLGAVAVEYGPGLIERVRAVAPDGVDAAIDLAGTDEAMDVSLELVPDKTRIATIAGFARGLAAGVRVLGMAPGADPGTHIRGPARLELVRLAEEGKLTVVVQETFPLTEAAEAIGKLMGGHTRGKIVLIP
ncbi:NADP-dependent oxidoreductase [Specibacter cremeus]|uniref:NADP-dependent oxidoreductase n=1 Tax=Specibacter cremeus TaxID=1629051 RepID=UPI000F78453C|nr:NADP-dependent oxidoreductase [Specibacter cremeus]